MNTIIEHAVLLKTYAVTALVIGLLIRYIIGRRRFYRRGVGGLQHFPNYLTGLLTMFIERVILWMGNMLIIIGIVLLLLWLERGDRHIKTDQSHSITFIHHKNH